ncbi:hypothetical protein B0H63DRAFT_104526 [Podospora didyma]|uniref:C2H2-type domain-containing protein n=1 Tax=Podospora didyma TaxID=330526 RepID=A0AAE0NY34_9PEZI|nr:hypothetical protein B0H63DRAFT_104526 [Podospora didyma]
MDPDSTYQAPTVEHAPNEEFSYNVEEFPTPEQYNQFPANDPYFDPGAVDPGPDERFARFASIAIDSTCRHCRQSFPSHNKLMEHLHDKHLHTQWPGRRRSSRQTVQLEQLERAVSLGRRVKFQLDPPQPRYEAFYGWKQTKPGRRGNPNSNPRARVIPISSITYR